jgi:uncharacterized cupredoxin-like copper-binding protein
MKLSTIGGAVIAAALLGGMAPVWAAEDEATVRVALLDMTSNAGMGPVGQAMMAPGMGSAMMGSSPGYNPAYPMGMMSIRVDRSTLKAGKVKFEVTNWSTGTVHDVVVVAVDNADAKLPYDFTAAQVAEDQVKVLAETPALQPNESAELETVLTPGTYMIFCNVPGHYASGMATAISVTP